jgi:hypothetical protein
MKKKKTTAPNRTSESADEAIYLNADEDDDHSEVNPTKPITSILGKINQGVKSKEKSFDHEKDMDDEDDLFSMLEEVREWNLEEKLNDQSKYNSKFVQFLDAKGSSIFHIFLSCLVEVTIDYRILFIKE